jgi:acyl-CoA synthetase (AMP-forming)/AMP-acid ligase II
VPAGQIGELIVRGPQVSPQYVTRTEANVAAKIADGNGFWHRMGDVGYLDDRSRFWYCGRKSDRLLWIDSILYPVQCEAIFNTCKRVKQSAIVYCGARPVLVVELNRDDPAWNSEPPAADLIQAMRAIKDKYTILKEIDHLFVCPQMPVDVRHNAKINREALSKWTVLQFKHRMGKY